MQNQPLDLASFVAAVLAVFVAPPLAHFMGVYAAILIGAVFGAGLALARSDEMTRWRSVGFVLLMVGVSVVTTVGVAEVINRFLHLESISPLLAPVSLMIAAVGKDWARVFRGAWASARRVFEGRYGAPRPPAYRDSYPQRGRFTRESGDE